MSQLIKPGPGVQPSLVTPTPGLLITAAGKAGKAPGAVPGIQYEISGRLYNHIARSHISSLWQDQVSNSQLDALSTPLDHVLTIHRVAVLPECSGVGAGRVSHQDAMFQ